MPQPLSERLATLANGEVVPLAAAINKLALLRSYAEPDAHDLDWDVPYHLRQVALGRPLEPELVRAFAAEGVLTPTGDLDPVTRAVVLSAARGEGREVRLDSPFTDPVDRAIAEFVIARDYLSVQLDPAEYRALASADPAGLVRDTLETPPVQPPGDLAEKLWRAAEAARKARPERPGGPAL